MKKVILMTAGVCLAAATQAQPVLTKALDYKTGDSLSYTICSAPGFATGEPGGNKVWQFDQLSGMGKTWIKVIPTSAAAYKDSFPTANYVELYADGSEIYRKHTATGFHIMGVTNAQHVIKYPIPQLLFQNPMMYNGNQSNTFSTAYIAGTINVRGTGTTTITADAYGKLVLPDSSYSHVLRVRTETIQTDTMIGFPAPNIITSKTTSYLWFDTAHSAALLKVDSIKITTPFADTNQVNIMYLNKTNTLTIPATSSSLSGFTYAIEHDEIILFAGFRPGCRYSVRLADLNGRILLKDDFGGQGNRRSLRLQQNLPAGIYLLQLTEEGKQSLTQQIYKPE